MGYRDDLVASQARAAALEKQLADAKEEIRALEEKPAEPERPPKPTKPPKPQRNRSLGKIYFNPPATYLPMMRLWWAGVRGSFRAAPSFDLRDTNNLLVWLLQRVLAWPIVNLVWCPVYLILLALVLAPVSGVLSLAITTAAMPLLLVMRLRVGDASADRPGAGWPPADFSDETGRIFMWILMSCCMQPLLIPMMPLLATTD